MSGHIRSLSSRKLGEVEALLARTMAMKEWLETAQGCGCATPEECALFPLPGDDAEAGGFALELVRVPGRGCRRPADIPRTG